jgi:hypothetical protein
MTGQMSRHDICYINDYGRQSRHATVE